MKFGGKVVAGAGRPQAHCKACLRPVDQLPAGRSAMIGCELREMPAGRFGAFVADIPAPLGIGQVELTDGAWVSGFICEPIGIAGAQDISEYGGWRAWLAARRVV